MFDALLRMDRRYIYLCVFAGVVLAMLSGFRLPVKASRHVHAIYDKIEQLEPGRDVVLVSFDFGPSTSTELRPMAEAVLRHCFSRGLGVVGVTLWAEGVGLGQSILSATAAEFGRTAGRDFAYLGFKAGGQVLILNMGQDFQGTFPQDVRGTPLSDMAVTANIRSLRDFAYVVDLAAGNPGVEQWIQFGQERYRFTLGAGCTAVMAPDFFPYLQADQLNGLMGGLAGGAEYETLIGRPGTATNGMRPQSVGHIIIVAFILAGNVAYFAGTRRKK